MAILLTNFAPFSLCCTSFFQLTRQIHDNHKNDRKDENHQHASTKSTTTTNRAIIEMEVILCSCNCHRTMIRSEAQGNADAMLPSMGHLLALLCFHRQL
jgi:hypothetical protein